MEILKNSTEGIYPYQQALWDKVQSGGFKKGELVIYSSARRSGKSYYYNLNMNPYKLITNAQVDDAQWFTVKCNREVSAWVRTQSRAMWYEHGETIFDVHEKIYTQIGLKW